MLKVARPNMLRPRAIARPLPAAADPDKLHCDEECATDLECARDEKCCKVGCSQVCSKAQIAARFNPTGVGFVLMLLCGWAVACGTTGPARKSV